MTDIQTAPSTDVVHPLSGEVLSVADASTDQLARFLADCREYESMLREAKSIVSREAIRRMDQDGTWTVRCEGYELKSQSPEPGEEWNGETLAEDLQQLADTGVITNDALARAVKVETVYKVQAAGVRALRKLGGVVRETVDRHCAPVEKRRYVTVSRPVER